MRVQGDRSLGDAGFLGDEMNMAVISGALCAKRMPRATAQISYCEGSYSGVVVNMSVLFRVLLSLRGIRKTVNPRRIGLFGA